MSALRHCDCGGVHSPCGAWLADLLERLGDAPKRVRGWVEAGA